MAIRTVVTRGYGNGTFNGTIPLVVTRGFISGDVVVEVTIIVDGVDNYLLNTNYKAITIYRGDGDQNFFIITDVN